LQFEIGRDKEKSEDLPKQWEVADDSVVVMKFRPVKPGNSVEDKTGMTRRPGSSGAAMSQKPWQLRRDEVYLKVLLKLMKH
jgi:hypothetical protein